MKKRKIMVKIIFISTVLFMLNIFSQVIFAEEDIRIQVGHNGAYHTVSMDQKPIMYQDRVLVPLRAVSEALDCEEVSWREEDQTAEIRNQLTILAVKIGAGYITKIDRENPDNVQAIPIDVPAMLVNGRTMVPIRAISEAFFCEVSYDGNWMGEGPVVTINKEFSSVGSFNQYGLAKAYVNAMNYGYINENKEWVLPPDYHYYGDFEDGLICMSYAYKEQYSYINFRGEQAIPDIFQNAKPFAEGLAPVQKDGNWFYIDTSGKKKFGDFEDADNFSNGVAAVKQNDKWLVIDHNGNSVTNSYDSVSIYGMYIAAVKNGKLGVVNVYGDTIVPFEYDKSGYIPNNYLTMYFSENFENGYFILSKNGKYGVVDKINSIIIPFKYNYVYGSNPAGIFMAETAVAPYKFEYEFINEKGEKIINESFIDAQPFICGIAPVRSEKGWGYLGAEGKMIIPAVYDECVVNPFGENYFIEKELLAVRDKEGRILYFDEFGNSVDSN